MSAPVIVFAPDEHSAAPFQLLSERGMVIGKGHECQCEEHDCKEIVACHGERHQHGMLHLCPFCFTRGHVPGEAVVYGPMFLYRQGARAENRP